MREFVWDQLLSVEVEEIDADANDELGTALGVVGDVDSDGVDDFAVHQDLHLLRWTGG